MEKALPIYKASAGSGKTFTLASEYITLVVKNPQDYSRILAVTFTNKATQEMKMRILTQLYGIAHSLKESQPYFEQVQTKTDLPEITIRENAAEALSLLTHHYNYFRVLTIDAFFQAILRNLARELNLTANLRIDLNDTQVEAQAVDDPHFSTVKSPNPENQAAFALAEELGRQVGADVLVATDPDADRVGVEVLQKDGSYLNLSGNQIGAIMAKYILEAHKNAGTLPENAALCKSIVSTDLVTKIAESYGATMFNVLTGFKFIAEKIQEFEEKHNHTYMMGFEESFGYLIKPFVRDKDAIQAVLVVAELAAYYRSRGLTLADGIEEIYKEYGYYAEKTISVTLSGVDGAEQIKAIMAKFRNNAPKEWNATEITVVEDFKAQTSTAADGTVTALTTPPSDVLKYTLADGSWIAVRPSGTEPKIKFYIAVVGENNEDSQSKIANIEAEINAFVK